MAATVNVNPVDRVDKSTQSSDKTCLKLDVK